MKAPAVYIMASQRNGTLYIGVTSDLIQRNWQHREGIVEGFTKQYAVKTLVWYEQHETMESAITREKALKKWNRDWKLRLIEKRNPDWDDLWFEIIGQMQEPQPSDLAARHSREGGNPVPPEAENLNKSNPHQASPSPNALIGDPALPLVQGTVNPDGATQHESTGFPPKTRGNDEMMRCGNDGNAGDGL